MSPRSCRGNLKNIPCKHYAQKAAIAILMPNIVGFNTMRPLIMVKG